jgi:4-methylaminobutanoate oxidase (formaldehyde-forming)
MRACGYRALESLRLEMGYRVWSTDLTPETNPYEAGLGFCVKLDKPGGFVGAEALREAKAAGLSRKLCCLTLDDSGEVVLGSEPVRVGGESGEVVGRITSGGLGYSSRKSIAYAYLPIEHSSVGARVDVNLFGGWQPGEVVDVRTLVPRG